MKVTDLPTAPLTGAETPTDNLVIFFPESHIPKRYSVSHVVPVFTDEEIKKQFWDSDLYTNVDKDGIPKVDSGMIRVDGEINLRELEMLIFILKRKKRENVVG